MQLTAYDFPAGLRVEWVTITLGGLRTVHRGTVREAQDAKHVVVAADVGGVLVMRPSNLRRLF